MKGLRGPAGAGGSALALLGVPVRDRGSVRPRNSGSPHLRACVNVSLTCAKASHQVQNLRCAGPHLGFGGRCLGAVRAEAGCTGDIPLLVSGGQVGQIPKVKTCGA